jgi:hypothetical protein
MGAAVARSAVYLYFACQGFGFRLAGIPDSVGGLDILVMMMMMRAKGVKKGGCLLMDDGNVLE